jgi:signal transduction histidine kinase
LIERAGELERLSVALQGEIEERTTVQEALEEHMDGLERKVAERTVALVASEARLVDAIETLPEAFVLFDAEDRLVVCNTAYRTLFSLTKHETQKNITFGEIKRRAFRRGLFADDAGNTEPEWQDSSVDPHSVGNKVRRTEVRLADGRWIEVQERRTLDAGFVSLQIDVTETRLRDEALAERNKLTALGQLAGGVAHEINNLLQPALIFPELVRDRLPPDDLDSREELDIVLDSVRKAREIVRNILLFSRKQEPTLETVDLAAETATAVKFVRDLLPAGILLQHHIDASPAMAAVNRTQLAQVLTNLVLNAVHAMDSRGAITVRLGQTRPSASQAEALAIGADANYLTLTVADTGTGMDSAVVARIFEPFFTTKPLGEGTGLGLSVVFGILRSWQGAIAVESKLGTGTAFTLYIPMVDPTPAAQLAPSVAA